jgi:hypothetical protein
VGLEFRQGLGSETAAVGSAHTSETRIYQASCRLPHRCPGCPPVGATDSELGPQPRPCRHFIGENSKGSRRPDPISTLHEDLGTTSRRNHPPKTVQIVRFQSGRPDLNRGPHRPELWAKSGSQTEKPCKSRRLGSAPPPLRSSDFAVDSRGLGSEIELLPNPDVADGRRVGTATFGREAAARATAQVPKSRVTTLDAGHSPSASCLNASPPRRPACVRDQS